MAPLQLLRLTMGSYIYERMPYVVSILILAFQARMFRSVYLPVVGKSWWRIYIIIQHIAIHTKWPIFAYVIFKYISFKDDNNSLSLIEIVLKCSLRSNWRQVSFGSVNGLRWLELVTKLYLIQWRGSVLTHACASFCCLRLAWNYVRFFDEIRVA